jgi:hypothetical protein
MRRVAARKREGAAMKQLISGLFALMVLVAPVLAQDTASIVARHMEAGTYADGERELTSLAARSPQDPAARMGLGLVQFARAVEKLGQGLHRHGLQPPRQSFIPILRLPVPENPRPEKLDYDKLRAVYLAFLADLAKAEATLAALPTGDVKLPIDLFKVRFDFNNDGRSGDDESLIGIMARIGGGPGAPAQIPAGQVWPVAFDRSDATWLRGYCNVMSAFLEFVLAYDWRETYSATAHVFFKGAVDPANPAHAQGEPTAMLGRDSGTAADAVALLHLIRWPLAEPQRMANARTHLKQMVTLSRQNWREIMAETDDDREWLPGPHQKNSAITALQVTQERVDGWMAALDEFDAVLDGRKLLPHWRYAKGIDFKLFFEQPTTFDLVLWFTGHAAVPYLKDGDTLTQARTREIQTMFGGNFAGFAMWFN